MLVSIYRSLANGLSFDRTGCRVAVVEAPDGSEVVPMFGMPSFLMASDPNDRRVRYAFDPVDVMRSVEDGSSKFRIFYVNRGELHAISAPRDAN